jgi:prolyl-tRNA editing enzyme YbaK/EbsC (Cys-tRNA(Pro) deacylase)
MRSHLLARRMIWGPALALALAAAITACSSSSSSSVSHTPSATPSTASASAMSTASAAAQIRSSWEEFFSGATPAAKKIALLQNGQKYAAVVNAQSGSSMAKSASAKVTAVKVISPTQATVTYDILIGGKPALSNQTGTAVYQDGTWKVGDAGFCQLLALENGGKAPSACSSAG